MELESIASTNIEMDMDDKESDEAKRIISIDRVKDFISNSYKEIKEKFSVDEMLYSLMFSLLPSVWDISSDILLGLDLEQKQQVTNSAICFLLVTKPILTILYKQMWKHLSSSRPWLAAATIFILDMAICSMVGFFPGIFKYSAIIVSTCILGIKLVAVFVHLPTIKAVSRNLAEHESTYESSFQLFILLYIWLSTGHMYLFTIISSVLVISKDAAENYLIKGTENLLQNKKFLSRIWLLGKYLPLMFLTTIFRMGSHALFLFPPTLFSPFPMIPAYILLNPIYYTYQSFFLLVLKFSTYFYPDLRKMSSFDMFHALNSEIVTITVWPQVNVFAANQNLTFLTEKLTPSFIQFQLPIKYY